ncbi:ubiquitin [Seminavis robusta]|uniref:60S ribosomal protein L41 n=1 Tax=Seminavis robusta TaxID=568900 RepID=A0A9N8E2A9_9STRA|nr:ubiquitin [Seminavis robusta]|eukprot:Sro473_g150080.1 ubiquitin (96) ;mRNA; f:27117-27404
MQIFVGDSAYVVDAAASVESFKLMVENREFIPAGQFRLVRGGDVLEGGSLEANGVSDDDELTMMLEVPAGMRRKWRKKRMRRLRRKRRKMRQRAR